MSTEKRPIELYLIHTEFLDEESVFQRKMQQVSTKRRERVLSYKVREDQKRSLAAGLLLERILNEYGYSSEMVAVEENGKLFLPGVDDFFFSLSHSGEYAACVISDVPVGVDIQKKRMTKASIAKRFFQWEEAERIENASEMSKEDLFFRYWTGKESYLKLTGQGLGGGLDSFFVDLDEMMIVDRYNQNQKIYLKEYKCLEDYYISVACYSKEFSMFAKKIYYRI